MHTEDLDELLGQSNPVGALNPDERRLAMQLASRSAPRRWATRPVIGAASVTILLGIGVGAATATGLWSPWAKDAPVASVPFHLPSGTSCEYRLGNPQEVVDGDLPVDTEEILREAFDHFEIGEREIKQGADYMNLSASELEADESYATAVRWAMILHAEQALQEHGRVLDFQLSGEGVCS